MLYYTPIMHKIRIPYEIIKKMTVCMFFYRQIIVYQPGKPEREYSVSRENKQT